MNEKQTDRLDSEAREQRAASELAPCELQAQSARCSVATGSLWVSAGLLLQLRQAWKAAAGTRREKAAYHYKDDMGHTLADALIDQAQTLDDCAEELRLLTEDAGVRQPTENNPAQTPEGQRPGGCL